jgi:hypothetical protein
MVLTPAAAAPSPGVDSLKLPRLLLTLSSPGTLPLDQNFNCASVPVRLRMCNDNGSKPWSSTTEVRADPEVRVDARLSSSRDSCFEESEAEGSSGLGDVRGLCGPSTAELALARDATD